MKRAEAQIKAARALVALGTLYVLLWCPDAPALNPSLDVSQYAHTAWTYRNGFMQGAVNAIAQTPDGYLWLGTQSGVVRFDGVRAVPLPLRPGQQLPSTSVGALLAARDGTLWIGTLDGLVSWKNGQLTAYPALARRTVLALLQDRAGTVWAGGLAGPTGTLCAIRGESTTCYGDDGSLGTVVASLYEDSDGSLWVGAATGLWRWRPGPPTRYLAAPISRGGKMTQGDHGSGLVVAVGSVRQIIGRTVTDYPLHGVPLPLTAGTVLRDRNGGLWIGTTAHGIVHSYEGKTSAFTHNDGLSSDQVYALFEGREGSIWVATAEGLDQFRELPVTSLPVKQGLSSATANSVLAARDGSVWVGTSDGLYRWKEGRTTIYRRRSNPGLPDDDIQSLFEDERGRIWVSSFRGLAAFEKGKFTPVPSVPAGAKNAIAGDNHGGLWLSLFGTAKDYSLTHLAGGKIVEQVPWLKLGGGPGTGLVPDPDGGIWTGLLSGGMAYFRAGQIRNLPLSDDGASARRVLDVARDRDGSIWATTNNGLSRINNGRVATLTTANGLPCNTVHWIIEDDLSSYWLYTQCGLLRVARTDMDSWIADPKRAIRPTTFDVEDGIRLVPILKGLRPAVTKASDGKIWFVNGETVSFIDPSRVTLNTLPPPVHIEQITADDKTVRCDERDAPAAARPQPGDRLHGAEPGRAGEGALPLQAGGPGSGLARGRQRPPGAVYEPRSGHLPLPRDCLQQQRRVERRRRDAGFRDPAGVVPDELVPRALRGSVSGDCCGRPTSCVSGNWRTSSRCAWKSESASAHVLPATCTTRCCRVFRRSCHSFKLRFISCRRVPADARKTLEDSCRSSVGRDYRGQGCRARVAHVHGREERPCGSHSDGWGRTRFC